MDEIDSHSLAASLPHSICSQRHGVRSLDIVSGLPAMLDAAEPLMDTGPSLPGQGRARPQSAVRSPQSAVRSRLRLRLLFRKPSAIQMVLPDDLRKRATRRTGGSCSGRHRVLVCRVRCVQKRQQQCGIVAAMNSPLRQGRTVGRPKRLTRQGARRSGFEWTPRGEVRHRDPQVASDGLTQPYAPLHPLQPPDLLLGQPERRLKLPTGLEPFISGFGPKASRLPDVLRRGPPLVP